MDLGIANLIPKTSTGEANSNIYRTTSAVYEGSWVSAMREAMINGGKSKDEPAAQLSIPSNFVNGNF